MQPTGAGESLSRGLGEMLFQWAGGSHIELTARSCARALDGSEHRVWESVVISGF